MVYTKFKEMHAADLCQKASMTTQQPEWLNKNEYPFESKFINQNGYQQHYIDEGSGDPIVFVHGTPSWSFDFRHVIKELALSNRCIALDHMGFGLSDKKPDYDYSLTNHIANLTRLIELLNLKDIVLVLHDFGGPIGLEYALQNLSTIKKIVVMNSWIGSSENEPEFQKMKKILKSPLLPFLYLRMNFSPKYLLPQSFGSKQLNKSIKSQFIKPFPSKKERYGMLAFAKSLLNDQDFFESQLQRSEKLASKPILLIWGLKDKFAGETYLRRFQKLFQENTTVTLKEAGHFPQEEEPNAVTKAILDFVAVI